MPIVLPNVIAAYFAADATRDAGSVSECFTKTAVVKDEGETYFGQNAIHAWKAASSTKYSYTVEPFAITTDDDRTVVTSHLEGDFPGSPVDLHYSFILDGAKIAELEIGL